MGIWRRSHREYGSGRPCVRIGGNVYRQRLGERIRWRVGGSAVHLDRETPAGRARIAPDDHHPCLCHRPPYTYAWTFGEGGTDSTQNPTHAYTAAGTYTVTLKVTDSAGVSSTSTLTVVAGPPGGAVAFTSAIAYSATAFVIGAVLTGLVIILLRRPRKK